MTAYSIHVGLNRIDPAHYGNDGRLMGCINDANGWAALAAARGFQVLATLHDEQATSGVVLAHIASLAARLRPGDVALITNASHGSQMPDLDGDEWRRNRSRKDQTWCTYDRMLTDDEIHNALAMIPAGVRVIFISDSCHSGDLARGQLERGRGMRDVADSFILAGDALSPDELPDGFNRPRIRLFNPIRSLQTFEANRVIYERAATATGPRLECSADGGMIGACTISQSALDGDDHGLATETFLKLLQASPEMTPRQLVRAARERIGAWQMPQLTGLNEGRVGAWADLPLLGTGQAA